MQIFVRYWHVLCRFVEYMCHCLTKVCSAVYEYLNGRDVKLPFSNEPRYCNWIHGEMTGAHFGLRPYFSTPFHGFSPYLIRPRLFPNEFWIFASIHSLSLSWFPTRLTDVFYIDFLFCVIGFILIPPTVFERLPPNCLLCIRSPSLSRDVSSRSLCTFLLLCHIAFFLLLIYNFHA